MDLSEYEYFTNYMNTQIVLVDKKLEINWRIKLFKLV